MKNEHFLFTCLLIIISTCSSGAQSEEYGKQLGDHLQDLSSRLARGAYRSPARRTEGPAQTGGRTTPSGDTGVGGQDRPATLAEFQARFGTEDDCRGSGPLRLAVVEDLSADSLVPFVEASVEPGSTLLTDSWQGYRKSTTTNPLPLAIRRMRPSSSPRRLPAFRRNSAARYSYRSASTGLVRAALTA